MSNNVAKGEARINQNHAFTFNCERWRLMRGAVFIIICERGANSRQSFRPGIKKTFKKVFFVFSFKFACNFLKLTSFFIKKLLLNQ